MKKGFEFDFKNCSKNKGGCDGADCEVCKYSPYRFELLPNPSGMACVESVGDAARDAIEYLESLYKFKGDFKAASHAARLENALERSGAHAS